MTINRSTILRFIMVLVICLVMLPCRGIQADEAPIKRMPVDVGIVVQSGIAMPTDTGIYYGFDAEFMYKIAQYANLKVVYHPYNNNTEMFQALRDGEIQMALGIAPNPERLQQFLFANHEFFTGQASIRVRKDDPRFSFGSPGEFNGKRIGVVNFSIMYERAMEWAEKSSIHPDFIVFENEKAMYDAMDNGQVDAIVATSSKYANSYRSAFNIATNTYYPIFGKSQLELKNKVDAAMNRILYEDSLYPEKLFAKYGHFQVKDSLPLSADEKRYIEEHPVLRVGLLENQPPFSYIDDKGIFHGITPDLYRQIGQVLDWQVEFVPFKNRADIIIALHAKEIDVYGVTTQDVVTSEANGLALTKTFFNLNMVYLRRSDAENVHRAAFIGKVPANVEKMLREKFPDVDFLGYSSLEECYDAMMARQVDAVFCNMAQLNWLTIKRGSGNFVVEGVDNLYTECSGQLLPENYLLNSILSKTVSGSNVDVTSIISHNVYSGQTTMDFLRAIPTRLVVIFFTVVLIITIIVSYSMYTSHKQKVQAELSAKQAALDASEQARQAESSFLSTMSHDMRTPLNGILGYTRLARGTQDMKELQQYLERIDSSSKLMLALVNDVLDLSKLSSGKMELREDRIVPHELFNIIKDAITMNANNHHIDFKGTLHVDDDVVVYADRLRLQQLAMNLLSNAVKYTQPGGHVVWDVHVNADGDKSTLVEIIQDDGIGMSEEFQRRMFDVFSQENREETVNTRGTGLGLSLVHKFITMMGGTIEVESKVNEGTTFIFTVPIKTAREDAKALALEGKYGADSVEEISKDLLKDVPILLVEDNEINAELAQLMLADYGANIIDWAHDGKQAVDFYSASERSHYKLILMDLRMPVMDGLTATKTIRMLHRADASIVPIIAMSADAYEADIRNCMEAGMQCHISKPVDINKLMKAIKDVL